MLSKIKCELKSSLKYSYIRYVNENQIPYFSVRNRVQVTFSIPTFPYVKNQIVLVPIGFLSKLWVFNEL